MGVHDKAAEKKAKTAYGIPQDEPIFVIRAQDDLAVPTLARYRNFATAAGLPEEFIEDLDNTADAFNKWREENPTLTKNPD